MKESWKHGNLHSNPYLHSSVKDTPQYLMPFKNIEGHEQSHKEQREELTPYLHFTLEETEAQQS